MKRNTKTIILDILTYIFLATVVVLVLMPLLWIISTSLKPAIEIFQKPPHWIPHNPTVSNYAGVITASEIPRAFLNSFLVGALATFLALALGGSAGYAFARFKFRGNKIFVPVHVDQPDASAHCSDDSDVLHGKQDEPRGHPIWPCTCTSCDLYAACYLDVERILQGDSQGN